MCTTPGNSGTGFGYATWSFSGHNANDNRQEPTSQSDQISAGTISYTQVNNNQDQAVSPKIHIDVKSSKIHNSSGHRRTMFAMSADGLQPTPATTAGHHVHTSTASHNQSGHVSHVRSKKNTAAAAAAAAHHDVFTLTHTCDKSGCNCDAHHTTSIFPNTLVFATDKHGAMSKHFMTPIGPLQLTAEECNEILMKRAAAASTQVVSSQADSPHFSHVLTHVNTAQIDTKHNIKQQIQQEQTRVPKERPYTCPECGKSFLLKHHLTTHARVHTGERPHICVHCGKSFAHKHCLHTHLLLHSAERPFQCRECKKSFTLKHHLVTHSRVHTRDRPFVCPECGKSFPLKRHLVTHNKFHTGERPYVCEECGESFAQKDHLTMHSRFHGSLHPFVCPDCGMSFQRKFELVNHGRLHGRIPHSCTVCGKEFLQKRTLLAHMRLHTGETPFACTVCGEAFGRKSDLIAHSKIHNSSNPESDTKPFTCRECGLEFNNKEAQTLHLRLHSADRTLVTDLCGLAASFQQTTGHFLTANASSHQLNGPLGSSVSHMHGATQTSPPVGSGPKPKPHLCPDCGRGFAQKHGLSQHQRRHTDGSCHIRSHVCDKCGKAFFQKNHLLLHQRQHMDPPPSIVRQQQRQAAQAAAQAASQGNPTSPKSTNRSKSDNVTSHTKPRRW
ncbi:gastrula zinc finger protein XlCGF26.1-like isoform X3 [Trichogramma pretiosum]|uniref:gastrula zinc finger protein XlCGF26.1-like isoform X3 n=1 Tax=Trichogramma pretiosum TaxID=7493 RepID=UPI000C71A41D|nr:gastrula zinc finger protein XlCGF26.1-like isoform X3 [Trichogramma pretiosum]